MFIFAFQSSINKEELGLYQKGLNSPHSLSKLQTILKLKIAGIIKEDGRTAFQKTEEILRAYRAFQASDQPHAKKLVDKIDCALEEIKKDPYAELISMIYFEGRTREECAESFNTTPTTISRNKVKLVNKLKCFLFSDDVIYEIFL